MKYCLLLVLILTVTTSFGQKYDFNTISDSDLPSSKMNVKLSDDFGQKTLKFNNNGAYIIFFAVKNPKEIRFDFLPNLLSDGQLNLIISYRKINSETFAEFSPIGKISLSRNLNSQIFSEYFIPSFLEGEYDIQLFFETTSLATFYLDNLEFIPFEQKELDELERNRKYISDVTNITTTLITANQITDFNGKVDIVKEGYVNNLGQLIDLSKKAQVLASLSKLVVFVNQRTKMGDPSSYTIFNEKINFIKSNCSEIQKNFLEKLISDAKLKEFQISEQSERRTGIMRVIQVAGEVGNIITGGRLKSILNSIQGLVTNIFNPNYLESKTVLNYIEKGKVKSKPNPSFDLTKANEMVNEGIELQKFFYNFLEKLEANTNEFNEIVTEFKHHSEKTDLLLSDIETLRKDYFSKVKYNMTDDFYNNTILALQNDTVRRQILTVQDSISVYFNTLKIPLNIRGEVTGGERQILLSDLEDVKNINKRIIDLGRQYKLYANESKNLFSKVESDLKKNNLFSKYDSITNRYIKDTTYKNSFEEYQYLKNEAEATFSELMNHIRIILN